MFKTIKEFFSPIIERPAEKYEITLTEDELTCKRADGTIEEVKWNELQKVVIMTTDEGPFVEDVFWVLHGKGSGCVIPQESKESDQVLGRLQNLPNFNNDLFMEAMCSTENKEFTVWEREPENEANLKAPSSLPNPVCVDVF